MAEPFADFEAIERRRDEAVAKLSAIEAPANRRMNQLINKKNRGEALSTAETAELNNQHALLIEVSHAKFIVAQISIQEINNSELLSDLRNKLEGITDDLKKTKAKLKKIGEVADVVAEGVEVLGKLGQDLAAGGKTALLT